MSMLVLFVSTLIWPQYSGQKSRRSLPSPNRSMMSTQLYLPSPDEPPPSAIYSRHWPPLLFPSVVGQPLRWRDPTLTAANNRRLLEKYQLRSSNGVLYSLCGVTVFSITPLFIVAFIVLYLSWCKHMRWWKEQWFNVKCSCTTLYLKEWSRRVKMELVKIIVMYLR